MTTANSPVSVFICVVDHIVSARLRETCKLWRDVGSCLGNCVLRILNTFGLAQHVVPGVLGPNSMDSVQSRLGKTC